MFYPVIKEDECTNCRACARICPKNCFDDADDKPCARVSDPLLCTGCESCEAVCPMKAIKVREI